MDSHTSKAPASASIPRILPAEWERFQGFRETLLLHAPQPETNRELRHLAGAIYDLCLETASHWPQDRETAIVSDLAAALADLRFLQGFLASVAQAEELSSLSMQQNLLCRLAGKLSTEMEQIADQLEEGLGFSPIPA